MIYSIIEVAKKLNITKDTLYYYEKIGLLPTIKRNASKHREYDDSDIAWIHLICCLRDINMPIQLIKAYVTQLKNEKSTLLERKNMLLIFKEKIEKDINNYLTVQKLIEKKLLFYNDLETNKDTNEISSCYNYQEDWEHFKHSMEEHKNG